MIQPKRERKGFWDRREIQNKESVIVQVQGEGVSKTGFELTQANVEIADSLQPEQENILDNVGVFDEGRGVIFVGGSAGPLESSNTTTAVYGHIEKLQGSIRGDVTVDKVVTAFEKADKRSKKEILTRNKAADAVNRESINIDSFRVVGNEAVIMHKGSGRIYRVANGVAERVIPEGRRAATVDTSFHAVSTDGDSEIFSIPVEDGDTFLMVNGYLANAFETGDINIEAYLEAQSTQGTELTDNPQAVAQNIIQTAVIAQAKKSNYVSPEYHAYLFSVGVETVAKELKDKTPPSYQLQPGVSPHYALLTDKEENAAVEQAQMQPVPQQVVERPEVPFSGINFKAVSSDVTRKHERLVASSQRTWGGEGINAPITDVNQETVVLVQKLMLEYVGYIGGKETVSEHEALQTVVADLILEKGLGDPNLRAQAYVELTSIMEQLEDKSSAFSIERGYVNPDGSLNVAGLEARVAVRSGMKEIFTSLTGRKLEVKKERKAASRFDVFTDALQRGETGTAIKMLLPGKAFERKTKPLLQQWLVKGYNATRPIDSEGVEELKAKLNQRRREEDEDAVFNEVRHHFVVEQWINQGRESIFSGEVFFDTQAEVVSTLDGITDKFFARMPNGSEPEYQGVENAERRQQVESVYRLVSTLSREDVSADKKRELVEWMRTWAPQYEAVSADEEESILMQAEASFAEVFEVSVSVVTQEDINRITAEIRVREQEGKALVDELRALDQTDPNNGARVQILSSTLIPQAGQRIADLRSSQQESKRLLLEQQMKEIDPNVFSDKDIRWFLRARTPEKSHFFEIDDLYRSLRSCENLDQLTEVVTLARGDELYVALKQNEVSPQDLLLEEFAGAELDRRAQEILIKKGLPENRNELVSVRDQVERDIAKNEVDHSISDAQRIIRRNELTLKLNVIEQGIGILGGDGVIDMLAEEFDSDALYKKVIGHQPTAAEKAEIMPMLAQQLHVEATDEEVTEALAKQGPGFFIALAILGLIRSVVTQTRVNQETTRRKQTAQSQARPHNQNRGGQQRAHNNQNNRGQRR